MVVIVSTRRKEYHTPSPPKNAIVGMNDITNEDSVDGEDDGGGKPSAEDLALYARVESTYNALYIIDDQLPQSSK